MDFLSSFDFENYTRKSMKESLASLDHDDLVDAALFLADNLFLKDQINRKAAMDRFASKSEQLFISLFNEAEEIASTSSPEDLDESAVLETVSKERSASPKKRRSMKELFLSVKRQSHDCFLGYDVGHKRRRRHRILQKRCFFAGSRDDHRLSILIFTTFGADIIMIHFHFDIEALRNVFDGPVYSRFQLLHGCATYRAHRVLACIRIHIDDLFRKRLCFLLHGSALFGGRRSLFAHSFQDSCIE